MVRRITTLSSVILTTVALIACSESPITSNTSRPDHTERRSDVRAMCLPGGPLITSLDLEIDGPYTVNQEDTYTWEAVHNYPRCSGPYYQWEVDWLDKGTSNELGTNATQSLYITASDGDFRISVTVQGDTITETEDRIVCNFIYPNDAACAW